MMYTFPAIECSDLSTNFEGLPIRELNKALKSVYVGARKTSLRFPREVNNRAFDMLQTFS